MIDNTKGIGQLLNQVCLCPQSNDMIKLHKEKISTEKEKRNFFWIEKARVVKTINPHIGSH